MSVLSNVVSSRYFPILGVGMALLLSLIMHWTVFTKDLVSMHVWRQTQTQATVESFVEEDFNIIHPRKLERGEGDGIFRMEFPIMQWLFAGVYKITGAEGVMLSRILSFIISAMSIVGLYCLISILFGVGWPGVTGAWLFTFSPSFFYHGINPMPDNFALCCSIWGLYMTFRWWESHQIKRLIWAGVWLGLSTMAKLPFIVYTLVPVYLIFITGRRNGIKMTGSIFLLFGIPIVPALAWYIWVIPHWHGNGVVQGMLNLEDGWMTILDYLQANLISNLPELLLNYAATPLFLIGFWQVISKRKQWGDRTVALFVSSLAVLAYFFFEINMIGKIHDYYLFPFLPFLFIIVVKGALYISNVKLQWGRVFVMITMVTAPVTCGLRMQSRWDTKEPGFNADLLEYKFVLQNIVPGDALCVFGNDNSHFVFPYYIHKMGWGFDHDNLSGEQLKDRIKNGAKYLYSDSKVVNHLPEVKALIQDTVLTAGSIKVYKLKTGEVN